MHRRSARPVPSPPDITVLLARAQDGDRAALDRLLPLVYDELRALAHRQRRRTGASDTLNTTAVVHEAYAKLAGRTEAHYADRVHFFRVAGRVMRDVLVDYARAQRAQKRGGGAPVVPLDVVGPVVDASGGLRIDEVLSVDDALRQLEALDARQAQVVEYRYFAGLSVEETAEALSVSPATVKRDWTTARAWLHRALAA